MNKVILFMEKVWLVLSVLSFLIALYFTYKQASYDAVYFYCFSLVAIVLFVLRRKQRLVHERSNSDETTTKK